MDVIESQKIKIILIYGSTFQKAELEFTKKIIQNIRKILFLSKKIFNNLFMHFLFNLNSHRQVKLPTLKVKLLSHVRFFAIQWTAACQDPPFMGFSRQEYQSGQPFLLQGIFPAQGLSPGLLHCRQTTYHLSH